MKTIFIVDDCETNLFLGRSALEGTYKTFTMPSAAHMFKLLEQITPDLILLDIEMPEMDGFEAISVLKSHEKHKTIPVVFLTSKQDEESKSHGYKMGALDYITKPCPAPVLVNRIKTHIEADNPMKDISQFTVE